ncbi:MAG: MFS transporter [Firmicutes bacterium]|nr:MFS transporter [Bacillota bacterium]
MYDWANSAFATTIMAAVLPIFYTDVAASGLENTKATSYWGYTTSIAMLIIAILVPILGAISDHSKAKKKFLRFFAFMGIIATSLLIFVSTGDYLLCSVLFIFGNIGFSGANVFYDSFLPVIADKDEIDYVSSKGFAMGYLGGGLLLIVNLLMIQMPHLFFIPNTLWATRISFLTVGIWWFIFSIPLLRNLKEEGVPEDKNNKSYVAIGFSRIFKTFKEIKKYKELFKFLMAFWLYNDGIGTIMRMATIYGREIGIGKTDLIGALLLTQFVGFPFSFLFGYIAKKIGAKKSIYISLTVYIIIVTWGYFLDSALDFWILAVLVGTVQGGSQALSRSLYGSMVPKNKSAEFYGFLGISSKFAAIFGPFTFALVADLTGSSRYGIFSLILFFIVGLIILSRVNEDEGRKVARL